MKPSLTEYPTPYPRVVARVCTAIRLIQGLLGVKTVYRLTLRTLQGFMRALAFPSLSGAELHHTLSPG
ncbi:MAG: hypothetical protein VB140_03930 [Burkholderia sp.]|nr:MAG: hypothetical protein E5299_00958 [Burkholderia gladioli]